MRRPGLILTAGLPASRLLLAPPCAAATSDIVSDQSQGADVVSTLDLQPVTVADGTVGTSTAVGQNLLVSMQGGASANLAASQDLSGAATATSRLEIDDDGGAVTSLTTTVSGNAADVQVTD